MTAARASRSRVSAYVVIVTDTVAAGLTERTPQRYVSAPQTPEQARGLVRVLLDLARPPAGVGPWRRARPGGQRTVRLEARP